ncbi:GntR family transcriptional regulator [Vallitalea maricola]|uniref:GntR family transcriptional regulator n=1 Tax=Vallitalea maricola TaxID=3074433 RepID=A0ACB5UF00_9FIRM|nr:GntR family transcriptional regulator [Vallitalea sp. AN17-2]
MIEEYRSTPRDEATEKIECFIIKNNLQPHTKIPSERDMCEMWGFNRTTLRSAIKRLIIDGKLYNKKGSGTFVADPKIERNLQDLKSLTELINVRGNKLSSKVISLKVMECNKQISKKLHISLGSKVYELVRLRSINNEPTFMETSYLDYNRFQNLDHYDIVKESLYNILKSEYKVNIIGGEEKIGITYVNSFEAELLNIEEDTAVFFLNGVTWDENNIPLEYFKSLVRADKVKFSSTLKK